jgi:hypothetical protein
LSERCSALLHFRFLQFSAADFSVDCRYADEAFVFSVFRFADSCIAAACR